MIYEEEEKNKPQKNQILEEEFGTLQEEESVYTLRLKGGRRWAIL